MLREDFTVDPRDVADARLMSADAVLLIAAALDPFELVEMHQLAWELDSTSSSRSTTSRRLEGPTRATLVGVNQRDLARSRSTTTER